jgi:hypothetical protein
MCILASCVLACDLAAVSCLLVLMLLRLMYCRRIFDAACTLSMSNLLSSVADSAVAAAVHC